MQYQNTIIGKILTPINRRKFKHFVDKYKGDFAAKKMRCWKQFVAILLGQLGNKAFNPNNVNNSSDTYKARKEGLLSSDSQVSFESKVGYNEGFYNNNSIMFKLPNNNILNTSYNIEETNSSVSFGADLQKFKIDYSHDKTSEDNAQAVSDKLSTDLKTQKNQFNVNLSNVTTSTTGGQKFWRCKCIYVI